MNSPWTRYHLFRNPFGELTRSERSELAVVHVEPYLAWLEETHAAIQFMGPCGHGKTTHLLAIERALSLRGGVESVGYVYFPEEGSQPALPPQRPLLVDEAQRMSRWRRRQLLRGRGPLVIGTHVDLTPLLRRYGFDVWAVDLDVPLSTIQLQQMLNRRILSSRLTIVGREQPADHDYHPLCLSSSQVVALQERFGSNIREIEHHLFDALQRFVDKGEPWLPVS